MARRKSDSPQKAAMREMMQGYLKENSFIQLMRLKDSTGSCVKSPKAGLSFQAMTAS